MERAAPAVLSSFCRIVLRPGVGLAAALLLVAGPASGQLLKQPIPIDLSPTQMLELTGEGVGHAHVMSNVPQTFNGGDVNARIGAERFYNAGITGQGAIVANVEAGHIWPGHETLGHVADFTHAPVAWDDPATPGPQQTDLIDRHATWVGHVLAGRTDPTSPQPVLQRGVAFDADLRSGAIATAWPADAFSLSFNFNAESFLTAYEAQFGTADVVNSSWGGNDPSGVNLFQVALDGLSNRYPGTTRVVSAGNAGPANNTVQFPGSGYNGITVGGLTNANDFDTVASSSSRGPQDWGVTLSASESLVIPAARAPIDLVAPSNALTLAFYGGRTGGNNPTLSGSSNLGTDPTAYSASVGGTSFAAPMVAGGAALLASAHDADPDLAANPAGRDARVVKAVLMNSAEKLPGWFNGQKLSGGSVITTQSLDHAQGAGRLDLDAAFDQYLAGTRDLPGLTGGTIDPVGWDFAEVGLGQTVDYVFPKAFGDGFELTATLSWFRDRDIQDLTVFENGEADLDLLVFDAVTGDVVARSISQFNLVEHLSFDLPGPGRYGLRVHYFGNNFGELTEEQFALAWNAVPEPAGLLLLSAGMLTLVLRRRVG